MYQINHNIKINSTRQTMEQTKPTKRQIFEAFTKVVDDDKSPEIKGLILGAIQNSKEKYGTNYLEEATNETFSKKLGRLLQL